MAIPAIAVYIATKMAKDGIENYFAVRAAAREYYELQRLNEAELRQLSRSLAQITDTPEWEWFQMLWNMKRFGLLAPDLPEPVPYPDPPNGDHAAQPAWSWWLLAGIGVFGVLLFRKK